MLLSGTSPCLGNAQQFKLQTGRKKLLVNFACGGFINIVAFCGNADYKPLFGLATRFLQPYFLLVDKEATSEIVIVADSSVALCSEVLRLLLALIKSHGRQAGASFGPATIAKTAPTWALAFTCQKSTRYGFIH